MNLKEFILENYKHFNAGELSRCSESLNEFLNKGGRLMITLGGAMSTAEIGKCLAPSIKSQKVHAICCTGANLEEELFSLIGRTSFKKIDNWRELRAEDDYDLKLKGMNRITDVAIPEELIKILEEPLLSLWEEAEAVEDRRFPHEFIYDLILHGELQGMIEQFILED